MDALQFGRFIAQLRKERGLTQAELAGRLHVSDKAVSKWERGAGLPDIANLEALATVFGLSLAEMLQCQRREKSPVPPEEMQQLLNETVNLAAYHQEKFQKKLRRLALAALAAALALAFALLLSPFMRAVYYDPAKVMVREAWGNEINRLTLDWRAYSELCLPLDLHREAVAEHLGYGIYEVRFVQSASFTRSFSNVGGQIRRGKLTVYDANFLQKPSPSLFAGWQLAGEGGPISERLAREEKEWGLAPGERLAHWIFSSQEEAEQDLLSYPENEKGWAWVSFDETLRFAGLQAFLKSLPDEVTPLWGAVETAPNGERQLLGYRIAPWGLLYDYTVPGYPAFNFASREGLAPEESSYPLLEANIQNEEYCQQHFTQLLAYLAAQKQFLSLLKESPEPYLAAKSYVEEKGLGFYGVVVFGTAGDMQALAANEAVYGLVFEPLS